jgi:hypothetical protein
MEGKSMTTTTTTTIKMMMVRVGSSFSLLLLLLLFAANHDSCTAFPVGVVLPRAVVIPKRQRQQQFPRGFALKDDSQKCTSCCGRRQRRTMLCLQQDDESDDGRKDGRNNGSILSRINSYYADGDEYFDLRVTSTVLTGQSALIVPGLVFAVLLKVPHYGFGPSFHGWHDSESIISGVLYTIPFGIIGYILDTIEDSVPPLKDVTLATQSSILNMLGGTWKPILGVVVASMLGLAAGIGEELLFRGVLQYELQQQVDSTAVALGVSSVIFGLLHAITPLYAILATLASLYFGWLYLISDNLLVPVTAHAFYDFIALLYAHYTVANMSSDEQEMLANWRGPAGRRSDRKDDNILL